MADIIIRTHEEEFSRISAEITVLCGKLKLSPTLEICSGHCSELDNLLTDADETLEQLELESRNLESGDVYRDKVNSRITSYRTELDRLKGLYKSCKREAEERSARIQLLNQDTITQSSEYVDLKETDNLLESSQDLLENSDKQLDTGRRLLLETENIGASVLSDLHSQRETIERSRTRLRDVESGLGQSHAIIGKMIFRARQNILLLYVIGGILAIAVLIVIYYVIM